MAYTYNQGLLMGFAIGMAVTVTLSVGTYAYMSWHGYSIATAKIETFEIGQTASCKLTHIKTSDEQIILITGKGGVRQTQRGGSLTVVDEYSLRHQATWGTKWSPPSLEVPDREIARLCTESANAFNLVKVQLPH